MGKIFVTDEVNDTYTTQVTSGKKLRVEPGASSHYKIVSAASSASVVISSTPCWLKSVIIGSFPATATCLNLYDTSGAANSGAESSGSNHIAKIVIPAIASAPTAQVLPYIVPFDVYCTTGLTYGLGQDGTNMGNHKDITIIYQT